MDPKPYILIVDASSAARSVIRGELFDLHLDLNEVPRGELALEMVEARRPDLVFLDLDFPKNEGFEISKSLFDSETTFDLPVIMTSSQEDEEMRLKALESGALEYVTKPFVTGQIRKLTLEVLERIALNRKSMVFSIDPQQKNRREIDAILKRHGFHHRTFYKPKALISALESSPPDVLVMDFQSPEHGAFRALDAIKRLELPERPKILATTGARERRDMLNALYSGADDLILKPYLAEELVARLEHLLRNRRDEAALRRLATVDALTGVLNRGELDRVARVEVTRALRDERGLGVLLLDVDHFKLLNDTHGHPFGDDVLAEVARALKENARTIDIVGRYGGEEFAVLMPRATKTGLAFLAERLRRSVEELCFEHAGTEVKVTISAGGQTWSAELLAGKDLVLTDLISPADESLYSAKESGRNRCVCDVALEGPRSDSRELHPNDAPQVA